MSLFSKTPSDLVRGIRSNKKNESQYIQAAIQEIKDEIKQTDPQKKLQAIQKLCYLQMLGYDMSWAAFHVIEVMSQPKFTSKRVGYLAASQSYNDKTDVTLLATHLIRKDMTSANQYEAGIAISCLSNICTPELARDLAADVVTLLNSGRPYVKKKACLVLYKIFLKFPDALRPSFQRLKEKLEDPEPSVQAAAVNVICELSRKNPKNYIGLAPTLFKLLTSSQSNWMLIKLVKLFGALLPIEPRLGKKLVGPLSNLISTTPAMSLLYECIQTCTVGLGEHVPTIKLCLTKLRLFVEDSDQNLKYLGLLALNNIIKVQPKAVAEHRDLVINCLNDEDINIRLRALDLLEGMVSKKNLIEIVRKLLDHLDKADSMSYKDAITEKIVLVCSKENYKYLGSDFEWYIAVLAELARSPNMKHGVMISAQFMDLINRVPVLRPVGVKLMTALLKDSRFFSENPQEGGNCEVLYSAGWIVGEFCQEHVKDQAGVIESLLVPSVATLPAHIQAVYMQAVVKIFGSIVGDGTAAPVVQNLLDPMGMEESVGVKSVDQGKVGGVIKIMQNRLPLFAQSAHLEVQERACFALELVNIYLETNGAIGPEIGRLFAEALNPVAPKAWKKVQVPEGLNLDEWINEPPAPAHVTLEDTGNFDFLKPEVEQWEKTIGQPSAEELARRKEYKATRANTPYHLGSGSSKSVEPEEEEDDNGLPPVRKLPSDIASSMDPLQLLKGGRMTKSSRKKRGEKVTILQPEDIDGGDTDVVDEDEDKTGLNADLDLNAPLRSEEQFKTATHRIVTSTSAPATKEKKKTSKKTSGKSEKVSKKKSSKTEEGKKKTSKEGPTSLIDMESFDPIGTPPTPTNVPSAPTAVTETKKKSTKTTKKSSTKEGTKKKSTKSTGSAQPNLLDTPTQLPAQPAQQRPANRFKPLCQDDQIGAVYEIKVNGNEPKKFMCSFAFKNLGAVPVTDLRVEMKGTLNVKFTAGPPPALQLQPGAATQQDVLFDIGSFEMMQKLGGTLTYTAGTPRTCEFQMTLPSSAFILPVKLGKEEFFSLLSEGQFAQQATSVRYTGDFQNLVVSLAVLLHSELITSDEKGAALYGKSIQGHHVATYVKATNPAQIMLRSSSAPLGLALVGEITSAFGQM